MAFRGITSEKRDYCNEVVSDKGLIGRKVAAVFAAIDIIVECSGRQYV
jgi:hypothetical protein